MNRKNNASTSKFRRLLRFALVVFFLVLYGRKQGWTLNSIIRYWAPRLLPWLMDSTDIDNLADQLAVSGRQTQQKIMTKHPSKRNYRILRHIIGIEKWGQSRLNVVLGGEYTPDEYDAYKPEHGLSWNELQDEFNETRQQTIALAHRIDEQDHPAVQTVPHNQLGPLTAPQWLYYLRLHADGELWKMN